MLHTEKDAYKQKLEKYFLQVVNQVKSKKIPQQKTYSKSVDNRKSQKFSYNAKNNKGTTNRAAFIEFLAYKEFRKNCKKEFSRVK